MEDTLKRIISHTNNGGTVFICTHLRAVKINKNVVSKWEKSGYDLFKIKNGSLFMARGKNFDCIDFCKIAFN